MFRTLVAASFCLLGGFVGNASAQALIAITVPRGDCRDQTVGRGGGVVNWRETVELEHCDRIKRLWSITRSTSYIAPPLFYDGAVTVDRLPRDIGVSMPILRVVFPERVFFDTAQSTLRPEAKEVVRVIAQNLRSEPPDVALFIAGHADMRGSREYNAALSSSRANVVAEAIRREGINLASIWRVGFGEDLPLDKGDSEEAFGHNRRVEFLFAGRPEVISQWMADGQLDMVCPGHTQAQVDNCIKQLPLEPDGYVIEEVPAPRVLVSPSGGGAIVSPGNERRAADLGNRAPTILMPVSTRRIRIDPINRSSGSVEVAGRR